MNEETIYSGNRFLVFALYPQQNIEVRVMWGREKQNVVFACGHSIVNRTSQTNVGQLMLKYGGGGHEQVGTCQVPAENWEDLLEGLVASIIADG
jgi:nanoRNase/pAp phosphatase (c-di-AMP/oligoRNAs hydrolase)